LGEGARSEQASEANQQNIKMHSFDDSVRLANLHGQDLELHARLQQQDDAHQAAQDTQHDWDEAHGIQYDVIPNTGSAVTDHLTAQTQATGTASIPAGTHLSADGKSILIPKQTTDTQAGQLQKYNTFGPAFGLPSLPQGAQFVPKTFIDMLQHKLGGYGIHGEPIKHDDLPGAIAALKTQRDAIANGANTNPDVLNQLDNTIGVYKANLKALDDHQADVFKKQTVLEAARAKALSDATLGNKEALQDNAAGNKPQKAVDNTELNAVAYDPNYQNPDGSKGGNVVMSKSDAAAKGLQHYKADPSALNSIVAGFNDVQNKLNTLADVANDPKRMGQVQPGVAAAMIKHDKGIEVGAFGTHADTSRINEALYSEDVKSANQATRDYVTAVLGAHEAVTQLPRLQTFGKSSRMTQQQMEAAQNLLPQPGDGTMAPQKMLALQQMLDPLRKQVPHMQGAETMPSWLEKQQAQKQQQAAPQAPFGGSNLANYVSGLQPK
jgi:hypothetical protein